MAGRLGTWRFGDVSDRTGRDWTVGTSVVTAVKITFDDGRWTLIEEAGTVTRFRPGTGKPDRRSPSRHSRSVTIC